MTRLNRMCVMAAAAAALAGGELRAASQDEVQRAIKVHYADLDLTNAAGRRLLEQRVRRAVDLACSTRGSVDVVTQLDSGRCRRAAWRAAADGMRVALARQTHQLAAR